MTRRAILAAAFLGCIVAANVVTTHYGLVPLGFGLVTTAGTFFAGLTFALRDELQETGGRRWVVALILAGAVLSYVLSAPFIAVASGVAFLLSELADFAVYTPLRRRGYVTAAIASNVVGAVVDTFLFLSIAGFPVTVETVTGQIIGKVGITLVFVAVVALLRRGESDSVRSEPVL